MGLLLDHAAGAVASATTAGTLDRYGAGRRMGLQLFATLTPGTIAEAMLAALQTPKAFRPVEADGAACAARMVADPL